MLELGVYLGFGCDGDGTHHLGLEPSDDLIDSLERLRVGRGVGDSVPHLLELGSKAVDSLAEGLEMPREVIILLHVESSRYSKFFITRWVTEQSYGTV